MVSTISLRERLRARLTDLVAEAEAIAATIRLCHGKSRLNWVMDREVQGSDFEVLDKEKCIEWMTKCATLLGVVLPKDHPLRTRLLAAFRDTGNAAPSNFRNLRARLTGIQSDLNFGLLDDLRAVLEAEVAGNYMAQAERLLADGQTGKFDHVPAAVLAGAVLEKALRTICGQQGSPIPTTKSGGKPKTLDPLISDLKTAGVFNEAKVKQLRAWAAIRNHAAHGEFDQFTRGDVEQMISGVNNFLADYLK